MNKQSGFTIVELLVVIVVIGILAALTVVSYTGITQKATAVSLQSDLAGASVQLKMYQAEYGVFPTMDGNNCPTSPTDSKYCLKRSAGNALVYSSISPFTEFTLTATNTNGTSYRSTNNSSPVAFVPITISSTGSPTITTSGLYTIYKFTNSGTFTPSSSLAIDYLVVAGGGGSSYGGNGPSGGGGAGGLLQGSTTLFSSSAITVGSGGVITSSNSQHANNGGDSSINAIVAIGGGGGGSGYSASPTGNVGGSGGGGSYKGTGATGTSLQGNTGGNGQYSGSYPAGGGGGAGGNGANGSGANGGTGGIGITSSISGSPVCYAGGGGGAIDVASGAGTASCGGGAGGVSGASGIAGTANTGGGAGGSRASDLGSVGGSGVVMIRFITP